MSKFWAPSWGVAVSVNSEAPPKAEVMAMRLSGMAQHASDLSLMLRGMARRAGTQRRLANNWRIIAGANQIAAAEASSFANRLVLEKDQWRDSAEVQVRKLRAALKEIADSGCLCCGESKQFPICTVSFPSTRSEWCEPCIAREALDGVTP